MIPETPIPKTPIFEAVPEEPRRTSSRRRTSKMVVAAPGPDPAHESLPMTIPGSAEQAAREVKSVSPEGRPAQGDAKAGPGRAWLEIAVVVLVVALIAVGIGVYFGIWAGLAGLVIGSLALVFNPVIGAVIYRARDRADVIDRFHS